mmetsp:Transcript_213/g.454  ORF Transcript_213/g.454 Transcript_213/m.454 type:complete len:333 (-) Transcript_213:838-1836(-)
MAMVFPSSLSVNLPSCGTSPNFSTGMGRSTWTLATTSLPLLTNLTLFFSLLLGSISKRSCTISHSSMMECRCTTALYPAVKMALCSRSSRIAIWASKRVTTGHGLTALHSTNPRLTSSSSMPLSLSRMFSPGPQIWMSSSSSMQRETTLTGVLFGMTMSSEPTLQMPASTLPMTTVPMSLNLSMMGRRKGLSAARSMASSASSTSKREPSDHQGHTSCATRSRTLAPVSPEMGTNWMSRFTLYPHCLRKGVRPFWISSKRPLLHWPEASRMDESSILFTTTMSLETPRVLASCVCSRVWPPRSKPVSNSPLRAAITRTPMSACDVPPIMFGT